MWTKFLNLLGFETKAQQEKRLHEQRVIARQLSIAARQQRVVEANRTVPVKTSQQVQQETYGFVEDYQTPGFNPTYTTGGYVSFYDSPTSPDHPEG